MSKIEISIDGAEQRVLLDGQPVPAVSALVELHADKRPRVLLVTESQAVAIKLEEAEVEIVPNAGTQPPPEGLAARFIEVLNRALKTDPATVNQLFHVRRECSAALANDPSIVVGTHEGRHWLSILGLINGLLIEAGSPHVIGRTNDADEENNNLLSFAIASRAEAKPAAAPVDPTPIFQGTVRGTPDALHGTVTVKNDLLPAQEAEPANPHPTERQGDGERTTDVPRAGSGDGGNGAGEVGAGAETAQP